MLAFGAQVGVARSIRKGDRAYVEGSLSASIWKTASGEPRLDLTIKAFKLERTGIGKSRPPRGETGPASSAASKAAARERPDGDWQAPPGGPLDVERGDDIGF